MLKILLTVLVSMILVFTNVHATSRLEFLRQHENSLVKVCESIYSEHQTASLYGCMLSEFYGLHKVLNILIMLDRNSEDWKVFRDIMQKYHLPDFETYDFMAVHLDFTEYLEGKEKEL